MLLRLGTITSDIISRFTKAILAPTYLLLIRFMPLMLLRMSAWRQIFSVFVSLIHR